MSIIDNLIKELEIWRSNNPGSILCTEDNIDIDLESCYEDLNCQEHQILNLTDINSTSYYTNSLERIRNKQACYELKKEISRAFWIDIFELTSDGDNIKVDITVSGAHYTYLFDSLTKLFTLIKLVTWSSRKIFTKEYNDNKGLTIEEVVKQILSYS